MANIKENNMENKRVVVTGMGAITPIGNSVDEFWNNAIKGKSGAGLITKFNVEKFKTKFACEIKDLDINDFLDASEIRKNDLYTQYALISTMEAINDSEMQLEKIDPFDIGVIWGTGQGGMNSFEKELLNYYEKNRPRFSPTFITKMISNMAAGVIAIKYGLMGINYTTVSACSTSNTAIMDAYNYIKMGKAKIIVTGGSEAGITEASVGGFNAMRALSTENSIFETASKPFDQNRSGFVLGEGAGTLILEDYNHAINRNAKIYCEIIGASMTADAYHITAPRPDGLGATKSMKLAMNEGNVAEEDVDYLNAHATSTVVGDIAEIMAISKAFQTRCNIKISATKSMTGHLLGAAGAIEGILTIKSINENIIPPTINLEEIDKEIPIDFSIVKENALEQEVNIGMSNSFGFGGHNSTVIFKKFIE